MVTPFGPVRAVAVALTFVKPPAGPWTTTCVSTVSPRAPESAMEESVPGTSVFPTLVKLGATHVLKFNYTPVPLMEIIAGELVALLVIVSPPATLPVDAGAKVTFKAADCPAARTVLEETLLALKPAPEALTPEIVTLELPVFLSVTPRVLVAPVSMLPKLKLVGLTLRASVEALTVRVAALLVTLPRLLLTATVNNSPLSALVVAGVV
jgi:hypothetical protein